VRRPWSMMFSFVVVCVVGASCTPASAPQPQAPGAPSSIGQPKRIVAVINGNPPALLGKMIASPAGVPGMDSIDELLSVGLTLIDNRGQRRPGLAVAVPTVENGLWKILPDGRMEMTWTIRPGAQWHDGTPLTASDAVFSALVARDRELPTFGDASLRLLDSVEAPDEKTVVARWKEPFINADKLFATQLSSLAALVPRHLLEVAYTENKESFLNLPHWREEFVSLGPFKLNELVLGSHVVLNAFDGFALGRPHLDVVEVRFIGDQTTLVANVLAGEAELVLGRSLSFDQSIQLRDQWKDGRMEPVPTSMEVEYPQFVNPTPQVLLERRFRQTLYHAMDRQQWVDAFTYGLTTPAHTVLGELPEYREMTAGVPRYEYDPRRAAQLIEGLGYSKAAMASIVTRRASRSRRSRSARRRMTRWLRSSMQP